ncbi:MAG: type II toxin-antitoxin system VapC family toxin [Terriglobia bacterium]
MSTYADTSFLVSLYLADANSATAAQVMRSQPEVFLTPLGEVELINALELALFRRQFRAAAIRAGQAAFREDVARGVYSLQPIPATAYELAGRLARRRSSRLGTRTLDILHVASALILRAQPFLTFDDRQRQLAQAEGLGVR